MATIFRTVFIALALGAPLAAQTPELPTAVVEGSVINIQNNRTIPRASVSLSRLRGGGGKSVRADGNGHFIFEHVEAGSYKLIADRQGFFTDSKLREYQPVLDVADGQHLKNVPVRLMPSALVTGQLFDEYNDPVQDVEIRLLTVKMRLGQMVLSPAGKTVTDDRGQYRIPGLHPGRYYLVAENKPQNAMLEAIKTTIAKKLVEHGQAGGARHGEVLRLDGPEESEEPPFTYAPLFYSATDDFQQAQALVLKPGDEVEADFIMFSAPVVSISGRVTNGMTGAPAGTAEVSAYWTPYMETEGTPARISTEDGRFEVRGVTPGHYTLRGSFTAEGVSYAGEQTVEVGIRGAQNVEIALLPDFVATGHVRVGDTQYSVLARSVIEFAGEGMLPRVRAKAVSNEYKFEVQLRQDRRYHAVIRNLPEDFYLKSVSLSGHEVLPDSVVVNGTRGDMELIVSPAGGHIEGSLYDSKDQPTRGSILLVPDGPQPGPPDLFRRTSADGKGKFTLRGVAPGSYRLVAMESLNLDSEINSPEFLRSIGNRGDSLIVEEGGKYTVSLRLVEEVR
jgi:Carboxypeptidase regulatory-like domain